MSCAQMEDPRNDVLYSSLLPLIQVNSIYLSFPYFLSSIKLPSNRCRQRQSSPPVKPSTSTRPFRDLNQAFSTSRSFPDQVASTMCRELLRVYPRCGHPKSSMGPIYNCPLYASRGRTCVNDYGQTYKDYEFIIEDIRTEYFVNGQEYAIHGGWRAEIEQGYKGYCHHCVEGRLEPMDENDKRDFLEGYLGDYGRWERRKRFVAEQESLMERFKHHKGETGTWTEAE